MIKKREVIIVLGVTGSGKTTWTKKFTDGETRLLAYDIAHDFNVAYMNAEELIEQNENPPETFRYGVWTPDDVETLIASAFVWGKCTLMLEELSTLYKTGEKISGPIGEVVYLGRHQTVTLICIAQRATSIPIAIRSQASRIVTFRQQEDDDVKSLVGKFGKERCARMTGLQDLHCMDWWKGEVSEYKITHPGEKYEEEDTEPDDIESLESNVSPDVSADDMNVS